MNTHHLSSLYQQHAPYRPTDPYVSRVHVAEFNAIKSTSPLLSVLKDRDFATAGLNAQGEEVLAINRKAIAALEYTCEQLCLDLCEAGGAAPNNPIISPINPTLFERLGMPCPDLFSVALKTAFSPLYAHGTRAQLTWIFTRIQRMAQDLVYWMIHARRQSALCGDMLGWTWTDSGIVNFDDALMSIPAIKRIEGPPSASAAMDTVDQAPVIPALDQLRIDYPLTPSFSPAPVIDASIPEAVPETIASAFTTRSKEPLRIEYPERKFIEYPGYPFRIPLITQSSTRSAPQLLLEYPDRRLISHPDHPFSIPLIPTKHHQSLSATSSPSSFEVTYVDRERESTPDTATTDMEVDGSEMEEVEFYFRDPANVEIWLAQGNENMVTEGMEAGASSESMDLTE